MAAFSIATLKVDSIRDDEKRDRIFEYLRSLKYDFYLLQETHVQTEDMPFHKFILNMKLLL